MSKMQLLRMIVKERLAAAAEEIFGVVERTIAEYQLEVACSKRDNDNLRRMLESSRKSEIYLHRPDPPPFTVPVSEEKVHQEQQHCENDIGPQDLNKELPDLVVIKKEEEESPWSNQREAQFRPEIYIESVHDEHTAQPQAHSSHLFTGPGIEYRYRQSQPSGTSMEPKEANTIEGCQENDLNCVPGPLFGVNQPFSAARSQKADGNVDGRKPYLCTVCGKCFSHTANMKNHMRVHTGEKPYSCKECGKRFIEAGNLNTHMRIHTGEKPFPCIVCGKWFRHRSGVNMHMRIHTGDKVYSCTECGKRFTESGNLTTHMRTHTREKPYPCTLCGKCFRHKSSLKIHMKTHGDETMQLVGHLNAVGAGKEGVGHGALVNTTDPGGRTTML